MTPSRGGEFAQAGVNGRRLTAAGGAGQQKQTGLAAKKSFQFSHRTGRQTKFAQPRLFRITEKAQDNLFAGYSGIRGDTNVVARADFRFIDATVLREGLLVGFEFAEELNSTNETLG